MLGDLRVVLRKYRNRAHLKALLLYLGVSVLGLVCYSVLGVLMSDKVYYNALYNTVIILGVKNENPPKYP
jgi:hypothetical protein